MAFNELEFTKTWLSPSDFPTEEDSEQQVRADLQQLHDEAKNGLNGLIRELQAASAAESLGAADENGAKTTVQQLLSRFTALFSGVTRLDHTLGEGEDALPTSAAVHSALDSVVLGDLSVTGGGYILQNVWYRTQHTPSGDRVVLSDDVYTKSLLELDKIQWDPETPLRATVYCAKHLTVGENKTLVPVEVTEVEVTEGSEILSGCYWSKDASFPVKESYYALAGRKAMIIEPAEEDYVYLGADSVAVSLKDMPAENGAMDLVYGAPGTWPSGYVENEDAAPYSGYMYKPLGPFRQLPLLLGQGGDVTVVAPDTLLYIPQTLTEEQKAQARKNIGAAAVGEVGDAVDLDKIVAAVLAALPKAEEADF